MEAIFVRSSGNDPIELVRSRGMDNAPHRFMQSIGDYHRTNRAVAHRETSQGAYPLAVQEYLRKRKNLPNKADAQVPSDFSEVQITSDVRELDPHLRSQRVFCLFHANGWADPTRRPDKPH